MMSAKASTQVARMLELVPYLQRRDGIRVDDVAEEFGVSPQQILKDLNALWFCGLPDAYPGDLIEIDMDALDGEGVVRLSNAEFLSHPLRLEPTEALAVVVALRALREYCGPRERDAVNRALAKVEAAAGEVVEPAEVVDIHVEPVADDVREGVERALHEQRRLHLRYYVPARDETTERDADPMRLFVFEGQRYLEAWCHRAEETRLFRLDRITQATVLDDAAEPPTQAQPLDLSRGVFQPDPQDASAVVELSASAHWVLDYFPVEEVSELADDRLQVTMKYRDQQWMERFIWQLGGQARVVEPQEVQDAARRRAREALSHYGTG